MVLFLGCPAQDQKLDSMILMGPLQLRIFCDSVIFFTPDLHNFSSFPAFQLNL